MRETRTGGWRTPVLLTLSLAAVIVVPFLAWGEPIERALSRAIADARGRPLAAASVLGGALAADILLPVPSSLVSTSCGAILGFWRGLFVSLAGMTVACVWGFGLGRLFGRPLVRRLAGERDLERFSALAERHGQWAVVLARAVPVLAEASVLLAGAGRYSAPRFFALTTLANAGISAAYSAAGACAAGADAFALAFAGAVGIPWLALTLVRVAGGRRGAGAS